MVPYTAVRDLLHEYFPESENKTSRACQRRLNYMLKNQSTADNVALFLEDVKQVIPASHWSIFLNTRLSLVNISQYSPLIGQFRTRKS